MTQDQIIEALVGILDSANPFYNPGADSARLEAAEAILNTADPKDASVTKAEEFLISVVAGKNMSGVGLRVRAAKILLTKGLGGK